MKTLSHDMRVSFMNNDPGSMDASLQNSYSHQIRLQNPENYSSHEITLAGNTGGYTIRDVNYLYLNSDTVIRIIIDGNNEILANHFSWINVSGTCGFTLEAIGTVVSPVVVQILHGKINAIA